MLRCLLLIFGISYGYFRAYVGATTVPKEVQLGGAIIAVVEGDIKREEEQRTQLKVQQFWRNESSKTGLQAFDRRIEEGRGKFHKQHKMLKYLYPLLVGGLIAKSVLIPLILKLLTVLSTSSFVMSKIALVVSGFLALKWIFGGGAYDGAQERTHLEVVHLPAFKPFHGGGGGSVPWHDLSFSGSNLVDTVAKQRHKYIPVGGGSTDIPTSSYRNSHHNFDPTYDSKPFL